VLFRSQVEQVADRLVGMLQVGLHLGTNLLEQLAAAGEHDLGGLVIVEQAEDRATAEQQQAEQGAYVNVEWKAPLCGGFLVRHRCTPLVIAPGRCQSMTALQVCCSVLSRLSRRLNPYISSASRMASSTPIRLLNRRIWARCQSGARLSAS